MLYVNVIKQRNMSQPFKTILQSGTFFYTLLGHITLRYTIYITLGQGGGFQHRFFSNNHAFL